MPLYDYQCNGCGHRFEMRQGFDAEPIEMCPRCQGKAHRRFHSVAVIYKGSGFYTTDYARKSFNEAGDSRNGASPDISSTSADGSEEVKSGEV